MQNTPYQSTFEMLENRLNYVVSQMYRSSWIDEYNRLGRMDTSIMYRATNKTVPFEVFHAYRENMSSITSAKLCHVLCVPDFLLHQTGTKEEIFSHFESEFDKTNFKCVRLVEKEDNQIEDERYKDTYTVLVAFFPKVYTPDFSHVLADFHRLFQKHANGFGHVPKVEVWEAWGDALKLTHALRYHPHKVREQLNNRHIISLMSYINYHPLLSTSYKKLTST